MRVLGCISTSWASGVFFAFSEAARRRGRDDIFRIFWRGSHHFNFSQIFKINVAIAPNTPKTLNNFASSPNKSVVSWSLNVRYIGLRLNDTDTLTPGSVSVWLLVSSASSKTISAAPWLSPVKLDARIVELWGLFPVSDWYKTGTCWKYSAAERVVPIICVSNRGMKEVKLG